MTARKSRHKNCSPYSLQPGNAQTKSITTTTHNTTHCLNCITHTNQTLAIPIQCAHHQLYRVPWITHDEGGYIEHYLPRSLIKNFVTVLWTNTCHRIGYDFDKDVDYQRMLDQIGRRDKIPLLELPWERPWTLVDLGEDYDLELLQRFYKDIVTPNSPRKDGMTA